MQFRIYGLLLIIAGFAIVWFLRPRQDGAVRCSKALELYVAILITFLIGMGTPLVLFEAPGQVTLTNTPQ
jgi:hypothetical protein